MRKYYSIIVKDEAKELIYLGIMSTLMTIANVLLWQTSPEELRQYTQFVVPVTIVVFVGLFFVRRPMLKQRFSKYLVKAPIKPHHYKLNYIVKAIHAGVFFATELFGIFVMAMSIYIIGFGIGIDSFEKIHVWETFASFGVFPFLGQLMPILLKRDEQHHKESQEKAGLHYESYY
jgi:hypothetical protein